MKLAGQSLGCVQAATSILGDKWTPRLLFVLANEKTTRFCQLQDEVGGINPRTLSARLSELETNEIIQKVPSGSSTRCDYRLTEKGRDLIPILNSMAAWGEKYPPSVSELSQHS